MSAQPAANQGERPSRPVNRRILAASAAALALLAALGGVRAFGAPGIFGGGAAGADGPRQPVKLGQTLPLTGESHASGEAMRVAAQMAVDLANAAGGVNGRPVELVTLDDACDPQTAVSAANALVRSGVAVSVGGYCSSATLPTVPIFRRAGIPMILPASNSDDLLKTRYDAMFLLNGTGTQEAAAALEWISMLGGRRVALVHDGTSYSANIAEVAAGRLRAGRTAPAETRAPAGLSVATVKRVTQGAPQHTRVAASMVGSGADVVYFTGYAAEAGRLTRDLRRGGFRGTIMVADGGVDPAMLSFAEGKADGVYATMPPLAEHLELPAAWTQEFLDRSGYPPGPFTVQAYDAVTLAVDALRRAGSEDGATVARAIAATQGLRLLTGPASFAPDHTLADFEFDLLQVRSDRFELVTEADLRAAKP